MDFLFLSFRCLALIIFTIWLISLIVLSNDVESNPGPNAVVDTSMSSSISSDILLSGLSIMHINIQSLRPKLDILEIEAQPYDILVLSETWLNTSIDSDTLLIPNFNPPFRCDRVGRTGGGVAIYISDSLAGSTRPDLSIRDLEAVWIQIKHENKDLLIGGFYRPPNSNNTYWSLIEESFDRAYNTNIDNIVILGDFNINMQHSHNNKLSNLIPLTIHIKLYAILHILPKLQIH